MSQFLNLIFLLHPAVSLEFVGDEQFSSLVKVWFSMFELPKAKSYLPSTFPYTIVEKNQICSLLKVFDLKHGAIYVCVSVSLCILWVTG